MNKDHIKIHIDKNLFKNKYSNSLLNDYFSDDKEDKNSHNFDDKQDKNSDISDDKEEDKSDISRDKIREPELWSNSTERYLIKLKNICDIKSEKHYISSKKNKKYYKYTSIATIILPLILANTETYIPTDEHYIKTILLTSISIINGIKTLFNFGRKCEIHDKYSGKYSHISTEIAKQLARKKRFRISMDSFLERITTSLNYIDENAPML